MTRRRILIGLACAAAWTLGGPAVAQDSIKIGLILPMTGASATTGKQAEGAVKLFMQQSGGKVAGKTVEVILKDDTGVADVTKRLAQELVVNDKVNILMGFGLTPLALAVAPIATQAKVPQIVTAAATAIITEQSPYIARTSFTLPQATTVIASWAAENGIKTAAVLVTDYAPGNDAAETFKKDFTAAGGEVV